MGHPLSLYIPTVNPSLYSVPKQHPVWAVWSQWHETTHQSLTGNYLLSIAADKAAYLAFQLVHVNTTQRNKDNLQLRKNYWQAIADREEWTVQEIVPLDTDPDAIPPFFAIQVQDLTTDFNPRIWSSGSYEIDRGITYPIGVTSLEAVLYYTKGTASTDDIINKLNQLRPLKPLPEPVIIPDPIDTEAEAEETARLAQEAIDAAAEAAEEARLAQEAIDDAAEKAEEAAEEARLVQQAIDDAAAEIDRLAENNKKIEDDIITTEAMLQKLEEMKTATEDYDRTIEELHNIINGWTTRAETAETALVISEAAFDTVETSREITEDLNKILRFEIEGNEEKIRLLEEAAQEAEAQEAEEVETQEYLGIIAEERTIRLNRMLNPTPQPLQSREEVSKTGIILVGIMGLGYLLSRG